MSFGTRVVLGLLAGLAVGALLAAVGSPSLNRIIPLLEPLGALWLNALRMTVIPLVFAMLITGIASAAETAATGRIAMRSLLLFVGLLTLGAILGMLLTPAALAVWPVSPEAAEAFRASASQGTAVIPQLPPMRDWIVAMVPSNPFKSAADGEILPLVIFALFIGFAASRITPALRAPFLGFFQALMETMLVIVQWVLWVAPVGVFALALTVGSRGGLHVAGALGQYLLMMSALSVILTLLAYPAIMLFGRVSPVRFAKAIAPVQALAISTQSSLATLPAMLECAQKELGIPERVTSITLPLAVSLFRMTSPMVNISIIIFVAHVYGVHLDPARLAIGVVLAVVTSWAVVGLPGQLSLFNTTVPLSLAMGVPLELLPLLLAVEVIPDIFRTVGNVTTDVMVTAIVARGEAGQGRDFSN
jgi:proton glutamate symport protein